MNRAYLKIAATFVLITASCSPTPELNVAPPDFSDEPVITFDAQEIVVRDRYEPPFGESNVEHLFPTTPAHAVRIWAEDRLQARGRQGLIEVLITDASVQEFQKKLYDLYKGQLAVEVKMYDGEKRLPVAETQARVRISRTIGEDASLTERENLFAEMTREMIKQLDSSLEQGIRLYFGRYIISILPEQESNWSN
jgi:hypothetical protein